MTTLVIQIPSRRRLQARDPGQAPPESRAGIEYDYALSPDGISLAKHGRCALALLPRGASTVIAVLADADVSWHRIPLPKAPAARLPAALIGVLEEALLEDAANVHLAVAPDAEAGDPTWIAAVDMPWLSSELAALEKSNVFIDRVAPMSWPDSPPSGHFAELESNSQVASLTWAHADGVAHLRLKGTLPRALLPTPLPEGARWSATPATASAAERWLNVPVAVMDWPNRALQASRSLWNLRQFGLARKNRGMRALRDVWRQFQSPAWKPLRYGVVTLIALQLVGLNLWAMQQRHQVESKRKSMTSLLQTTFPHVRGVLNAPLQMQRETDTLRAAAGKPGETDFEPMLQAAASAWPGDRPPVDNLRFEPGKLSLSVAGWSPAQIEQFRNQLRPSGWQIDAMDGRITMTRISSAPRSTL